MTSLSPVTVVMFVAAVAFQIVMVSMLPLSQGYTKLAGTLGVVVSMNLAAYLLALLVARGAQLSLLLPVSATAVPLAAIALGVFVYGESASWPKVILLVVSALLIGIASALK